MPNGEYVTITVSKYVYDTLFSEYEKKKKQFYLKGVSSFSGFITYHLVKILKIEVEK